METTSQFLYLVGGLVVAALIVSFGFFIYTNNKETANSVVEQTNKLNTQLQESEWLQYDGTEITGSEVLNVIKRFQNEGTFVTVDGVDYCCSSDGSFSPVETTVAGAKKRTGGDHGEQYIPPSSLYLGEVKYIVDGDRTSGIAGIEFTRVAAGGGAPAPAP